MNTDSAYYKFASVLRIITLTIAFIGLIAVLLNGYINSDYDLQFFLLMGAFIWQILYTLLIKISSQTENSPSKNTELQNKTNNQTPNTQ